MRHLLSAFFMLALSIPAAMAAPKSHAIAMHQDVKYPKDFTHFAGTNPDAPQGGTLRLGVVGTFDSTNPFTTKGTAPVGLSRFSERFVFEGLLARSPDEPFTLYAWIAESIEVAPDRSWIIFHVNPKAKWADGKAITAEDVIFTHTTLRDKGAPNMRMMYSRVKTVEKLGPLSIKFTFKTQDDGTCNPEMPLLIGLMSVLPKHFFDGKDFEKTSLEPVLGSGPYRVTEIKPGHRIAYERRQDYWGEGLPVVAGKHNFQRITAEYYRDVNVARLAFEAGEYDFRAESDPAHQKKITDLAHKPGSPLNLIQYEHEQPAPLSTYCMNTRRDIFKDRRVRLALSYALDFHWINKNLYHGQEKRNRSFFENTGLAHQGLPSEAELKLLEKFKEDLPAEVFSKPYYPVNFDPKDNFRTGLQQAKDLLKGAGWEIRQGSLINIKTGDPFIFELMLYNKEDEKVALAFARTLKILGITMTIRTLDAAQYEMRRLKFDYDMILNAWDAGNSPGAELAFYWGSDMVDQEGSRNYPGLSSPAVDFLCKYIAAATKREDLVTGCHALDRVLMWGHYVIPLYYNNKVFIAHTNKLGHPKVDPKLPVVLSAWWSEPEK